MSKFTLVTYAVPYDPEHDEPEDWRESVGQGIAETYSHETVEWDDGESENFGADGFLSVGDDPQGVLHRHEDGREHRHFSAGFTIGKQVREDQDGTESHSHFLLGVEDSDSGPVVWNERDGDVAVTMEGT